MMRELAAVGGYVEEIFFCPHHPDDGCGCRKPKPGMLHAIQNKYGLVLSDIYFIGDSQADMGAAEEAHCKPILVMTGNGKKTLEKIPNLALCKTFKIYMMPCNTSCRTITTGTNMQQINLFLRSLLFSIFFIAQFFSTVLFAWLPCCFR